ncbi:hypothetical protein AYI69_g2377 [Smittium culicis]|uniref:Uncharacterized protein n=1 Tax=Smittium culicis TaxID=133412 RepID=A0A1R1YML4_9FUNG|nr:hypothetical protein AYI69_g2377 [Smittium culicis]
MVKFVSVATFLLSLAVVAEHSRGVWAYNSAKKGDMYAGQQSTATEIDSRNNYPRYTRVQRIAKSHDGAASGAGYRASAASASATAAAMRKRQYNEKIEKLEKVANTAAEIFGIMEKMVATTGSKIEASYAKIKQARLDYGSKSKRETKKSAGTRKYVAYTEALDESLLGMEKDLAYYNKLIGGLKELESNTALPEIRSKASHLQKSIDKINSVHDEIAFAKANHKNRSKSGNLDYMDKVGAVYEYYINHIHE